MLQLIALQKLYLHWQAPAEAAWAGAGSGWWRWAVCAWAQWCCCLRKCCRVTSAALCAQKPEAELESADGSRAETRGWEAPCGSKWGCPRSALTGTPLSFSLAAFVGRNVILTSGCIIGACCNVNTYEVIPENTVIYGADCLRRVQTERPQVGAAWGARPSAASRPLQLPSWQQRGRALIRSLLLSSPKRCSWIS